MESQIEDEEILDMINEAEDYYEYLLEKYKPLLLKICQKYQKRAKEIGYELEDLMQVANMGVLSAISAYSEKQNTCFYTFLFNCVTNKLKTEIRDNSTNKRLILNKAYSYDVVIPGTDIPFIEMIKDDKVLEPYDIILEKNRQFEYINFLNSLPFYISIAYDMRNSGFPIAQIGSFLRVSKRTIYNYVSYAKKELLKKRINFEQKGIL